MQIRRMARGILGCTCCSRLNMIMTSGIPNCTIFENCSFVCLSKNAYFVGIISIMVILKEDWMVYSWYKCTKFYQNYCENLVFCTLSYSMKSGINTENANRFDSQFRILLSRMEMWDEPRQFQQKFYQKFPSLYSILHTCITNTVKHGINIENCTQLWLLQGQGLEMSTLMPYFTQLACREIRSNHRKFQFDRWAIWTNYGVELHVNCERWLSTLSTSQRNLCLPSLD